MSNKKREKEKYIDAVSTIKKEKKQNDELFEQISIFIKEEYQSLEDMNYAVKGERINRMIDEMDNNLRSITKESINSYENTTESLNKRLAKLDAEYEIKMKEKEGEH